jgi:hypothetical protein
MKTNGVMESWIAGVLLHNTAAAFGSAFHHSITPMLGHSIFLYGTLN